MSKKENSPAGNICIPSRLADISSSRTCPSLRFLTSACDAHRACLAVAERAFKNQDWQTFWDYANRATLVYNTLQLLNDMARSDGNGSAGSLP
jgi:hypothetical protein